MHHAVALVALVGIPLAQVPLVAYLSKYVELDSNATLPAPGRGYVTYGAAAGRPDRDEEFGACPDCGTAVDPDFDYCGECAAYVGWLTGDRE